MRQVIKETSLFFALPALLDLFRRWGYRARYRQMAAMATRPEYARWAAVVPAGDPPPLTALARLQVLNTLIIASELQERGALEEIEVIRYETSVLDPAASRQALARLVPEAPGLGSAGPAGSVPADDTFATTTRKETLPAGLTAAEAGEVSAAAASALSDGPGPPHSPPATARGCPHGPR